MNKIFKNIKAIPLIIVAILFLAIPIKANAYGVASDLIIRQEVTKNEEKKKEDLREQNKDSATIMIDVSNLNYKSHYGYVDAILYYSDDNGNYNTKGIVDYGTGTFYLKAGTYDIDSIEFLNQNGISPKEVKLNIKDCSIKENQVNNIEIKSNENIIMSAIFYFIFVIILIGIIILFLYIIHYF